MQAFSEEDRRFMARALQVAERGRGSVEPNPMVGCVLTINGRLLSEGYHEKYGQAHAEVRAVENLPAGKSAKGATAYVTLEPCSHYGKTPPCCDRLVAEGVARVVVAMQDPNPLVSGRGLDYLRQHSVAVQVGLMEQEARRLNEDFVRRFS